MSGGQESGMPACAGVSKEPERENHEEIQIIIYAQNEPVEESPGAGSRLQTSGMEAEEEEFPELGKHNDVSEILSRNFDFSCPRQSCDFRSMKKSAVILHVKAKHGTSGMGAVRKCPYCDHVTAHVSNLRTHILARHSQQRPWICNQCDKRFADRSYYNAHVKRHRNDLRHLCSTCNVRFLLPSHLRAHMESRHSKAEVSDEVTLPRFSPLEGSECLMDSVSDANIPPYAENSTPGGAPVGNYPAQRVPDHDYSLCYLPRRPGELREIFECLSCSSFFASIESLRVHSVSEHGVS